MAYLWTFLFFGLFLINSLWSFMFFDIFFLVCTICGLFQMKWHDTETESSSGDYLKRLHLYFSNNKVRFHDTVIGGPLIWTSVWIRSLKVTFKSCDHNVLCLEPNAGILPLAIEFMLENPQSCLYRWRLSCWTKQASIVNLCLPQSLFLVMFQSFLTREPGWCQLPG